MKSPLRKIILAALLLAAARFETQAQEILDQLDSALHMATPRGDLNVDLSGLADLELYMIDQRPPGLLFGDTSPLFNPRLSLFLDVRWKSHWYAFLQARADRGFDPRSADRDARIDEYFVRYTPFDDSRLSLQVGKFATVVGSWVRRHDSWQNPFITAPLPYENVTAVSDKSIAPSRTAFLGRKNLPDNKFLWLPVLWGPAYTSGGSVFGATEHWDYAAEFKNASVSSRPAIWDATDLDWDSPTVSSRIGYRTDASWNFGLSASGGTYILPGAIGTLPAGTSRGDYRQITLGHDVSYAWHHWQIWGEVFFSRFEVPYVGDADTAAYYIEAKYKFSPSLYGALRWNQQLYGDVENAAGGQEPWDNDVWRIDCAIGYRFTRHIQTKAQYSFSQQRGDLQQGEQLVAGQLTVKF
jgi:hypothetical protein